VSQKLLWHRTKEPTPIRSIRPEIPDGLATVVAKMMAKDPKARYQTPAQVAAALEEWLPAVVPLPAGEEMPQLSPAVADLLEADAEGDSTGTGAPEVVAEATETARTPSDAATAVLSSPKVATAPAPFGSPAGHAAPFGATAGSPWASAVEAARPAPLPIPQAEVETPPGPPKLPTTPPSGPRRNPFADANPFAADATTPTKRGVPWAVIAGVLLAALAVGGLVVALR
jgi:hypothetical protein